MLPSALADVLSVGLAAANAAEGERTVARASMAGDALRRVPRRAHEGPLERTQSLPGHERRRRRRAPRARRRRGRGAVAARRRPPGVPPRQRRAAPAVGRGQRVVVAQPVLDQGVRRRVGHGASARRLRDGRRRGATASSTTGAACSRVPRAPTPTTASTSPTARSCPRPLGVNPLLTISALAERACALLIEERGWNRAATDTRRVPPRRAVHPRAALHRTDARVLLDQGARRRRPRRRVPTRARPTAPPSSSSSPSTPTTSTRSCAIPRRRCGSPAR